MIYKVKNKKEIKKITNKIILSFSFISFSFVDKCKIKHCLEINAP